MARTPRPKEHKRYTTDDFLAVIPGSYGIMKIIAQRLGCAWHTAKHQIESDPVLFQAYNNEKKAVDDTAVNNIVVAINNGDLGTSMWWVKMKMGGEFHETQRHEVTYEVNWDDDNPTEA